LKRADLHVHTDFSDGTFPPERVIEEVKKKSIDCIAICDHDCIDGLEPAIDAAKKEGIELIPGIELTAEKNGSEIHMLGYCIDWKNKDLLSLIERMQQIRVRRIHDMIKKLKTLGVDIKTEDVFKLSKRGSIGRLHLACAIYNSGYTRYVSEAFRRYIGDRDPCYVGKFNLTPYEAINAILKAGGVPVLAHPGVMGRDDFITDYIKHGLRGLEVYHSDHSASTVSHYLKLAEALGLLVTGGSDCHGLGKGKILMGRITIDYRLVEELKRAADKIKNKA